MTSHEIIRYIISPLALFLVALINYIKRKYELIAINSDHFVISRLFMAELPLYSEDIETITLKELQNDKAKVVITSNNRQMNFHNIDSDLYEKLLNFCKQKYVTLYLENMRGVKEKMK